jgi:hypothetical protein
MRSEEEIKQMIEKLEGSIHNAGIYKNTEQLSLFQHTLWSFIKGLKWSIGEINELPYHDYKKE